MTYLGHLLHMDEADESEFWLTTVMFINLANCFSTSSRITIALCKFDFNDIVNQKP